MDLCGVSNFVFMFLMYQKGPTLESLQVSVTLLCSHCCTGVTTHASQDKGNVAGMSRRTCCVSAGYVHKILLVLGFQ